MKVSIKDKEKKKIEREVKKAKKHCPEGMIYIPSGSFMMGSGELFEEPVHKVYLDGYYIDRYPVTNAQYYRFCKETGHNYPEHLKYKMPKSLENHPVIGVSWEDAEAFASWAGKKLPTEAEWEKSARGTDGRIYPWGNEFDPEKCNFNSKGTTPVDKYPEGASPYGVMGMVGNVWEWVQDWWDDNYYKNAPADNPQGPFTGKYSVLRGGSWEERSLFNIRASVRVGNIPSGKDNDMGFRCVRQVSGGERGE